ncbi:MAG: conjugal transfer protein TrbF [Gammaproteobacteria bacterium]|nr:conjugal transfer protein TrbF [Gammaproteobacteria bacterium]
MFNLHNRLALIGAMILLACAPAAQAQWAVVDVGAITQLIQQVETMQQQLSTAQSQLSQARTEFGAITGGRGMERLLSGTQRNYLPSTWNELQGVMQSSAGSYGTLSASVQSLMTTNAVLSPQQAAALSATQRAQLDAARRSAALAQATSRDALANSSQRFASLQQLIDAIPGASDPKAILDLQARIAAEQGMLQNEHSKLDTLSQVAQADERSRQQQLREQAIADIGSFRRLPAMGL